MSYCQDHVYLVEKLQSAGDFQEVLYRRTGCPYCMLGKLEAQSSKYRAALAYYAQPETYYIDFKNMAGLPTVCVDNGDIAREALEEI